MGIGIAELFVILVIVVLIFGASRLPALGRGVGAGIRNLKQGLREGTDKDKP
jgi:sec-independent protein translocase protein TatA